MQVRIGNWCIIFCCYDRQYKIFGYYFFGVFKMRVIIRFWFLRVVPDNFYSGVICLYGYSIIIDAIARLYNERYSDLFLIIIKHERGDMRGAVGATQHKQEYKSFVKSEFIV